TRLRGAAGTHHPSEETVTQLVKIHTQALRHVLLFLSRRGCRRIPQALLHAHLSPGRSVLSTHTPHHQIFTYQRPPPRLPITTMQGNNTTYKQHSRTHIGARASASSVCYRTYPRSRSLTHTRGGTHTAAGTTNTTGFYPSRWCESYEPSPGRHHQDSCAFDDPRHLATKRIPTGWERHSQASLTRGMHAQGGNATRYPSST
ncbi:unnamed protein product, partial [Ectocarpus sp. 8 AP-2014]